MLTPSDFDQIQVEALPVVRSGDAYIIAFKMWDYEDFDTEFTVAFSTTDFESTELISAEKHEVIDLWSDGERIIAMFRFGITELDASFKPVSEFFPLPFTCKALAAQSVDDLYIVGDGVGYFDGQQTFTLDALDGFKFEAASYDGDTLFAVGRNDVAEVDNDHVHTWEIEGASRLSAVCSSDKNSSWRSTSFPGSISSGSSFRDTRHLLTPIRSTSNPEMCWRP